MASEQKCQSGVDVLNFHKIADCNKLFSHSQMCDLDLVWSRSLPCFSPYKFLWVRLGMLSVKLLSLSPAPCTSTPAPWRPPSSIPHPPPIVRVFFNGVMKRTSTLEPNFTELGPGRSEISRRVSNPSNPALLPSPAPRKIVGEAARRRAGNRNVWWRNSRWSVPPYHEPRQKGRMAAQHSVHPSPAARTNRSGKDWQSRRRRGLGDTASWLMLLSRLPWWEIVKFHRVHTLSAPAEVEPPPSRDGALSPTCVRSKPARSTDHYRYRPTVDDFKT